MANVTVDIKSSSRYPVDKKRIVLAVEKVLDSRRVTQQCYVSVTVVGDRKMRSVNRQYRQKDYSTDVLSFPTSDPSQPMDEAGFAQARELGIALGDLLIAYPQAVKIASAKNRLLDDVVADLVEHGMLHLLGIHHD